MKMDPRAMRARFAELRAERDKAEAKLTPMQDELAAARAKARKEEDALVAKIKKAREPLIEIDGELAMISRALNGKTGEPVAEAEGQG